MKPFHPYILVAMSCAITAITPWPDVCDGVAIPFCLAIPDG
jgi:hypothetical protein